MHFEEIARELVQTTSRLVRGRIINIMDTEGRIVASTEKSRIGSRHAGACQVLLATADAYYDCGASVGRAAERLHIHKNTLQYRVHRLWELLCPGTVGRFEREYLLRLCIQYHGTKAREP